MKLEILELKFRTYYCPEMSVLKASTLLPARAMNMNIENITDRVCTTIQTTAWYLIIFSFSLKDEKMI